MGIELCILGGCRLLGLTQVFGFRRVSVSVCAGVYALGSIWRSVGAGNCLSALTILLIDSPSFWSYTVTKTKYTNGNRCGPKNAFSL